MCENRTRRRNSKHINWQKSYSTNYTMHSKENKAIFQDNIVVKYSKGNINKAE
ncbi:hypothetical protein [Methanobrevibacter curvatus]|uniref:hypothetical protein n=1 Tax=Methanobrevibacter curvatus TaxID=49547 RepID=UPI0012EE731B|nr:hypothetical protein [Methanobrevibacter curvatus]